MQGHSSLFQFKLRILHLLPNKRLAAPAAVAEILPSLIVQLKQVL
jgi:hypothetical protein